MKKIRINFPEKNEAGVTMVRAGIPPIGSIIWNSDNVSPAEYWGGIWERFAKGQVVVGVDENDSDFVGATSSLNEDGTYGYDDKSGGEKEHTLIISEMPSHKHTINNPSVPTGENQVVVPSLAGTAIYGTIGYSWNPTAKTGGDEAHNNLQPYVTAYAWRRLA